MSNDYEESLTETRQDMFARKVHSVKGERLRCLVHMQG